MVTFGINVSNIESVRTFIEQTNTRLQNPNMLHNPFFGKLVLKDTTLVVHMKPIYPNVAWIGIPALFLGMFMGGWKLSLWCLIVLPFLLAGIFYSKYFFYLVLKKALKKCQFIELQRIKLLSNTEVIRRLIDGPE